MPSAVIPSERGQPARSEEHTSELQSRENLVCRLLHEKKNDSTVFQKHRGSTLRRIVSTTAWTLFRRTLSGPLTGALALKPRWAGGHCCVASRHTGRLS